MCVFWSLNRNFEPKFPGEIRLSTGLHHFTGHKIWLKYDLFFDGNLFIDMKKDLKYKILLN